MKKIVKDYSEERMQRVVTFLNRGEVDFLDKLGKDALFSTGLKLSRARLIAWLIDFIEKLNISGKNLKSERDLERRIIDILKPDTIQDFPPATEGNGCKK
jgi:hypothetical protein